METNDTRIAEKCRELGFTVTGEAEQKTPSKFEGMDVEQVKAYAAQHNIDIGNATSLNGIIKKITEAEAKD